MNGRLIRVAMVLAGVLALSGFNNLHAQTEPTTATVSRAKATKAEPQRAATVDPSSADFTTDLTPMLKGMKLRLGSNFVTETRDGLKVYAVVQVTGIKVMDSSGLQLRHIGPGPSINPTARRSPQSSASGSYVAAPGTGGDDDPRCWHCYDKGGQTHCFEIACPFLAAPGTGSED
jgi:hypothetical protein